MNSITLTKIDESNFIECFNLKLGSGQDKFVSHPIRSLAQAYVYYSQCTPFGICDNGRMVGYVMVIYDYDEQTYNIWHMMIDGSQQGNGFGKAALELVLEYIKGKPFGDSGRVALTCNKDNPAALNLYKSFGFELTGGEDDDEVELALTV